MFGPRVKTNPYIIRSHAEDAKGALVRSLMPLGETVTTLEIDVIGKRMVIHTGKTVANVDEPKACRTKLAAKTDAQNILNELDMGWHRVTVYGDWRKQAMNLARLYGITVNERISQGRFRGRGALQHAPTLKPLRFIAPLPDLAWSKQCTTFGGKHGHLTLPQCGQ